MAYENIRNVKLKVKYVFIAKKGYAYRTLKKIDCIYFVLDIKKIH